MIYELITIYQCFKVKIMIIVINNKCLKRFHSKELKIICCNVFVSII